MTATMTATSGPVSPRRNILVKAMTMTALTFTAPSPSRAADLESSTRELNTALEQLNKVPNLISEQKWDAIRALLTQPPLKDLWAKNTPFTKSYASLVSDELSALESGEDLLSHLRYLDMSAYNNVFNPIATEGTAGATKELVRSYYEDPTNEYKASVQALKELIALSE